jgi:hypothetical protein
MEAATARERMRSGSPQELPAVMSCRFNWPQAAKMSNPRGLRIKQGKETGDKGKETGDRERNRGQTECFLERSCFSRQLF